MHLHLVR